MLVAVERKELKETKQVFSFLIMAVHGNLSSYKPTHTCGGAGHDDDCTVSHNAGHFSSEYFSSEIINFSFKLFTSFLRNFTSL